MKSNRKYFVLVFVSLLVLKSFFNLLLTTFYYVDKELFIEKFCENIDKPELECNGKCKLKKIAENTSNKEKTPQYSFDVKQLTFLAEELINMKFFNDSNIEKKCFFYLNNYFFISEYLIDYPPKF